MKQPKTEQFSPRDVRAEASPQGAGGTKSHELVGLGSQSRAAFHATQFEELVGELSTAENPSSAFAELLELLAPLTPPEFRTAVADLPQWFSALLENYLAATVEQAAVQKKVAPPEWTRKIKPLEEPVFGSTLRSLRQHLLFNSPPAFRRRNIFIDASVGARV